MLIAVVCLILAVAVCVLLVLTLRQSAAEKAILLEVLCTEKAPRWASKPKELTPQDIAAMPGFPADMILDGVPAGLDGNEW